VAGFRKTETTNKVWKENYIELQTKRFLQGIIIVMHGMRGIG
jgi:hypothetical protein